MFGVPIIRPALAQDLASLTSVVHRAYRRETAERGWTNEADLMAPGWTPAATLEEAANDPAQRLLVATQAGLVVGCVAVRDVEGEDRLAHLGQLCVEPVLQGRGIGRALILAAERTARDSFGAQRVEMVVIDHRDALLAWYARRGYLPTGERRLADRGTAPPLTMVVVERRIDEAVTAA